MKWPLPRLLLFSLLAPHSLAFFFIIRTLPSVSTSVLQMHFIDVSSTTQFDGGRFSMILCSSSRFISEVFHGASDNCLKDMRTVNNLGQWGHHLSLSLWSQMHSHCPLQNIQMAFARGYSIKGGVILAGATRLSVYGYVRSSASITDLTCHRSGTTFLCDSEASCLHTHTHTYLYVCSIAFIVSVKLWLTKPVSLHEDKIPHPAFLTVLIVKWNTDLAGTFCKSTKESLKRFCSTRGVHLLKTAAGLAPAVLVGSSNCASWSLPTVHVWVTV